MTSPPQGNVSYPTLWRVIDSLSGIDVRQMSEDTYQLRSPTNVITVNTEGFNLFRDHSGGSKWNQWLRDNKIKSLPREDTND